MIRIVMLFVAVFLASGCAGVPFRETPPASMEAVDPQSLLERYQQGTSGSFQLLNSVVFDYTGLKFSGIGSLEIDTRARTFHVACLNPMGVKLFELSGDDRGTNTLFALEPLARYGDIGAAVGSDIKRIYLDLVPFRTASLWKRKFKLVYSQHSGAGFLDYVYSGAAGVLTEKSYYEDQALVWRVTYHEYQEQDGKLFPRGIVLVNYRYGYELTVRQKEFTVEKP